jgi:hypothetical protein
MLEQATRKPARLAPLEEAKPTGRNRVSKGHGLFDNDNVDGRSKASRRFRDIASAIARDLGGSDRLSEGERQLIRRSALICVSCELMEAVQRS